MVDKIGKFFDFFVVLLTCLTINSFSKGKKVLLGNFWNFHRNGIHQRYCYAKAKFLKNNPDLEEWELVQFVQDQSDYYKVLNEVDRNVEAAFMSKRVKMRHVVDDAIIALEDALRMFDDSLF